MHIIFELKLDINTKLIKKLGCPNECADNRREKENQEFSKPIDLQSKINFDAYIT